MSEIRLEGVTFDYPDGTRALDAVDLLIEPGTSLALVGANGSGKTTLARHLNGLLRPSGGRVLLDGVDTADLRVAQLARSVGLCFQQPDRQIFGSTRSGRGRVRAPSRGRGDLGRLRPHHRRAGAGRDGR